MVAANANETASGYQAKLVVCLPPPDVPAGTPGRATFGAKLFSATFGASAITQPVASGDYRDVALHAVQPRQGHGQRRRHRRDAVDPSYPDADQAELAKKKLTSFKTVKRNGKKVRVKVIRTRVTFSSAVTENGAAATAATITTTAAGKRVGGATGRPILTAKSATVTATAVVNRTTPVPTGQTASANDLYYRALGTAACVKTAAFGGLPCVDATVAAATVKASVVVKKYLR